MKARPMSLGTISLLGVVASLAAQAPVDSSVARFYEARWFQPAWIRDNSIAPRAVALLEVISHADRYGLDPADYLTPALDSLLHRHLAANDGWQLDSLLTRAFLTYAQDISRGRVEPSLIDSQWTRSPHSVDLAALLETTVDMEDLAPSQQGYVALRDALQRYDEIARHGDWPARLGARLAAEGYDTTAGVPTALLRFQERHGLEPDGIVGPATQIELRVSAGARARQIALNMERWRWLPRSLGDRYIVVNSAAFVLQLVENGAVTFTTRAVVGRQDWPTPIASSYVTDIIFRPVWTVPRTIAEQELLPIIRRDSTYLSREGFRVLADGQLVQEPGPTNPLGGMKLVFWTPFSVFIHDTPTRPSFSERWRAFSHGCVRVEDAAALAARLLPAWSADAVRAAMGSGRQRWVRLPQAVPVHLVHWTAWVADDGAVAFADDPYGWDEKLARALATRGVQRAAGRAAPASASRISP